MWNLRQNMKFARYDFSIPLEALKLDALMHEERKLHSMLTNRQ